MPDELSFSEQHERERRYQRYKRWWHGDETELDRAEASYERMWSFLCVFRFWPPFLIVVFTGWISPYSYVAGLIGTAAMMLAYAAAAYMRGLATHSKNFKSDPGSIMNGICRFAFGIVIIYLGACLNSPGTVIGALVMVVTAMVWGYWARAIMRGTRFARMHREQAHDTHPYIME